MTVAVQQLREFEAFVEPRFYLDELGIYLIRHTPTHTHYVRPVPLTIEAVDRGEATSRQQEPSFSLPRPMTQAMVTALWRVGVRPYSMTDDSDRVRLQEAHIADLRKQLDAKDEQLKQQHTVIRELNSIIAERAIQDAH